MKKKKRKNLRDTTISKKMENKNPRATEKRLQQHRQAMPNSDTTPTAKVYVQTRRKLTEIASK